MSMLHREEAEQWLQSDSSDYSHETRMMAAVAHAVLSLGEAREKQEPVMQNPLLRQLLLLVRAPEVANAEPGSMKWWDGMARQCGLQAVEAQKREMQR